MLNNVVLDVVIGLVFIYLLYSLLASTINEFVAMIFAYRHRMLEKAIEQMLDGQNYSYYWWNKLANIFRWVFNSIGFKFWSLCQLLKAKPSGGEDVKKKEGDTGSQKGSPKYVSRIDYLTNLHVDKKKMVEVGDDKKRIAKDIRRSKIDKKAALFAFNITSHPLYRRKSEQSFLFKKPAYLSATAFSDILMDVLSDKKSAGNHFPILMNDIKKFVDNKLEKNKDLKGILNIYIEQANGDVQKFKLLLEDWYDDTMERVSGWYKRQATKILFLIGLVLAFSFNISTIDIVRKLSVNKDLREAMAQSASNYVRQRSISDAAAVKTNPDSLNAQAGRQLRDIKRVYTDTIAPVNMMMGMGWDSSVVLKNRVNGKVREDALGVFSMFLQWLLPDSLFNEYYSGLSILSDAFSHPDKIIGFLITALAITLGAPFWFDLLNKFVNIRAGGNDPTEKNGKPGISKTVALNQKPKPNSFG